MNCRSLRNKIPDFLDFIFNTNIDICTVTETWFSENDSVLRAQLNTDGFSFLDVPRVGRRGGGTGILFNSNLSVKNVHSGEYISF